MPLHQNDPIRDLQTVVEEATFDFTMGDSPAAIEKLNKVLAQDAEYFPALHALTEIHLANKDLDQALEAAERAHAIQPDDIHINTSLSRIWVERGDKAKAEHFGAQARIQGWKEQLKD